MRQFVVITGQETVSVKKSLNIAAIFLVIFLVALGIGLKPKAGQALTLTPPMLELGGDPGTDVISKVRLLNESMQPVEVYTSTANFTAKDETGNPYFLFDEKTDLATWFTITAGPIKLLPGERQDIPFSIKIPRDAEPGGHYAGIFFGSQPQSQNPGEASNVGVQSKLGMLVILRVSGATTSQSAIQEFHILNDQSFFTSLPVRFWYRLRNTGNVHVRPFGSITVRGLLGWRSATINANPIDGAVLPNSTRRLEAVWQRSEPDKVEYKNFLQYFFAQAFAEASNFAFGRYTAQLNFITPVGVTAPSVSFWVFPWQLIIFVLFIIIVGGFILIKGIKAYNNWVVKKYTRKQGN